MWTFLDTKQSPAPQGNNSRPAFSDTPITEQKHTGLFSFIFLFLFFFFLDNSASKYTHTSPSENLGTILALHLTRRHWSGRRKPETLSDIIHKRLEHTHTVVMGTDRQEVSKAPVTGFSDRRHLTPCSAPLASPPITAENHVTPGLLGSVLPPE